MTDELFHANRGLVHHVLLKVFRIRPGSEKYADAESHANEALLRAARRFDPAKGACFATFACICVRRGVVSFLQLEEKRKRLRTQGGDSLKHVARRDPPALEDADAAAAALAGVPLKRRLVLRLRYYEWLEPKEMGAALGVSRQAADSRVRDALRCCREVLGVTP